MLKDIAAAAFQRVMEAAAAAARKHQQKDRYVVLGRRTVGHTLRIKRDGKVITGKMPVEITRVVERRIHAALGRDRKRAPYRRDRETARRRRQIARGILGGTA